MSTITQTNYVLPQSVISNGDVTGMGWLNSDNILLTDGLTAQSQISGASDITVGNFNIDLPLNAVITGVSFKVIGYRGSQTNPVITLSPFLVDNTSGENVYYPYVPEFTGLTEEMNTYIFGGQNYQFATSLSVSQINNLKLQFIANGEIYVDSILASAFYYIPDTVTPPSIVPNTCETSNSQIQTLDFNLAIEMGVTDTKFYLKNFYLPDGRQVTLQMLGDCGGYIDMVIDEGKAKIPGQNSMENVRVLNWTYLQNGTCEMDCVSINNRALDFVQPYTHNVNLLSAHSQNATAKISNNSPFYDRFLKKGHIGVLVSEPISVSEDGVTLADYANEIDFVGAGVTAVNDTVNPKKKKIIIPGAGGSTPPLVIDTVSNTSGTTQVTNTTVTTSFTGVNRGALVRLVTQSGRTVTVTIGGTNATLLHETDDSTNDILVQIWGLANPTAGNQAVDITLSTAGYITYGVTSLANINVASLLGTVSSNNSTSTTPSTSITTTTDNSIVFDVLGTKQTPILYTQGANSVIDWSVTSNSTSRQGAGSYQLAGTQPDNVVMSYSITQNTPWVMAAVEIKGVTSAGAAVTKIIPGTNVTISPTNGLGDVTINATGGSGGSGTSTKQTITQTAHGFTGSLAVRKNTSGVWVGSTNTVGTSNVMGIIESITDVDTFIIVTEGLLTGSEVPVASPGTIVYNDASGNLTTTQPVAPNVSRALGAILVSGASMIVNIDTGFVNTSTGGTSSFLTVIGGTNIPSGTFIIPHTLGTIPSLIQTYSQVSFSYSSSSRSGFCVGNSTFNTSDNSGAGMVAGYSNNGAGLSTSAPSSMGAGIVSVGVGLDQLLGVVTYNATITNVTSTDIEITVLRTGGQFSPLSLTMILTK